MTNIGILGSGRVATALATKLAATGHDVCIGARDPKQSGAKWTGPSVEFGDPAQAAGNSSIVINATPGESSLDRIGALRKELTGKILVDVSNATEHGPDGLPGYLSYPNSSLAEHLQQALPDTQVVKTLNTMLFSVMTDPHSLTVPPTAFLSGNDTAAKATVTTILIDLGWPAEWIEDLGDVSTARGPEAVILLVPPIVRSRGFAPFAFVVAN